MRKIISTFVLRLDCNSTSILFDFIVDDDGIESTVSSIGESGAAEESSLIILTPLSLQVLFLKLITAFSFTSFEYLKNDPTMKIQCHFLKYIR